MPDLYAEQLPYWKSGQESIDTIQAKIHTEIQRAGGVVSQYGDLTDSGRTMFFVTFTLQGDQYRIAYPVLKSRSKNQTAAVLTACRRQAVTMMYHDVKSRCVSVRVLGARTAFGGFRLMPDGRTDGQTSTPELLALLPLALPAPRQSQGS
jgi:hypothetical protein